VGGRRAPVFAGVAAAVLVLLVALFLVLPKMGQVSDANTTLTDLQGQQATLSAQLAALKQAQTEAPINRETIRKVQQAIPPTVDQQGFILLLQNAAVQSSIDVVTISPSTPVFDAATGLSTVTNAITVLAMAGKIAPRPSSPFSREVMKAAARRIARARRRGDRRGSSKRRRRSTARKNRPQREPVGLPSQRVSACGAVSNSSAMSIRRGLRACGLSAIRISSGTITVRDQ